MRAPIFTAPYIRHSMRLFATLLALYVLALNMSACADDGCEGKGATTASVAAAQDHAEHADLCSPFCTCACCAGANVVKASSFTLVLPVASVVHTIERTATCSMPRPPVWQPPQA